MSTASGTRCSMTILSDAERRSLEARARSWTRVAAAQQLLLGLLGGTCLCAWSRRTAPSTHPLRHLEATPSAVTTCAIAATTETVEKGTSMEVPSELLVCGGELLVQGDLNVLLPPLAAPAKAQVPKAALQTGQQSNGQAAIISLVSSVCGAVALLILLRVARRMRRGRGSCMKRTWSKVIEMSDIVSGADEFVDELGYSGLYTDWREIPLSRGCLEELRSNPRIRQRVPRIDAVVRFAERKLQKLRSDDETRALVASLSDDEVAAIAAYTFDLQNPTDDKSGNLYFELNNALRVRENQGRHTAVQSWGILMRYTLDGLHKLPSFESTDSENAQTRWLYRGLPGAGRLVQDYTPGRGVKWRAFVSCSLQMHVAMQFGDAADNLVFRIKSCRGKQVGKFSAFPAEDEVLLLPGAQFQVASAAYAGPHGCTFVDLTEVVPTLVF